MPWVLLLSVLLSPVAAPPGYERAWDRLPERHRALVRSIHVDRDSGGQARRSTMSVHLTPWRGRQSDVTLVHEVCHLILWSDRRLELAWRARFWPNGSPRGRPPTKYARTDMDEDFAISCEKARDGDGPDDPERARFFGEHSIWP